MVLDIFEKLLAGTLDTNTAAGATAIDVASVIGFSPKETVMIDMGANSEKSVVVSIRRAGRSTRTLGAPLTHAHAAGSQVFRHRNDVQVRVNPSARDWGASLQRSSHAWSAQQILGEVSRRTAVNQSVTGARQTAASGFGSQRLRSFGPMVAEGEFYLPFCC